MSSIKSVLSRLLKRHDVRIEIMEIRTENRLSGHTAIITGGGSGIGLSIAERFYNEGAKVIITGRNEQKLIAASADKTPEHFSYYLCDMEDVTQVKATLQRAVEEHGADILVNNAGVYTSQHFLEIGEEDWARVLRVNLTGAFFAMQAFCDALITRSKRGRIINICSNTGILGATSCYSASKWGLIGLTKGLGKEMLKSNIVINGIAPGMVASPINGIKPSDNLESTHTSDGRIAIPSEIAEIALFLAADASEHLVGQIISCDGGESLTCTYC